MERAIFKFQVESQPLSPNTGSTECNHLCAKEVAYSINRLVQLHSSVGICPDMLFSLRSLPERKVIIQETLSLSSSHDHKLLEYNRFSSFHCGTLKLWWAILDRLAMFSAERNACYTVHLTKWMGNKYIAQDGMVVLIYPYNIWRLRNSPIDGEIAPPRASCDKFLKIKRAHMIKTGSSTHFPLPFPYSAGRQSFYTLDGLLFLLKTEKAITSMLWLRSYRFNVCSCWKLIRLWVFQCCGSWKLTVLWLQMWHCCKSHPSKHMETGSPHPNLGAHAPHSGTHFSSPPEYALQQE